MSASDLIGVAVVNQQNEKIGTLDDLLIEKENQVALAVISVGGFLGVGDKLVAVPYQDLQIVETDGDPQVVAAMTKEDLEALPSFQYELVEPAVGDLGTTTTGSTTGTTVDTTTTTGGGTTTDVDATQSAAVDFEAEKQTYTGEYATKIDEYEGQVRDYSGEMDDKIDSAWAEVKNQWSALQAATEETWEDTKLAFERAWDSFTSTWDEANRT
jgi:sporulation protein YlmC with PRC-barrel domain